MDDFDPFKVAELWHGGQGSALYKFLSAGRVVDAEHKAELEREIRKCLRLADDNARMGSSAAADDEEQLDFLLDYVRHEPVNEGKMKSLKEALNEVAPPGFEKAVKAMKKDKSVDNPYAVAWSMKKKGDKPSDDMDEMDASQPYASTSMAGLDEKAWDGGGARPCSECGMLEGHKPGCSMMDEADREPSSYDYDDRDMDLGAKRAQAAGKARQDARRSPYDDDTACPECGAPHGMEHDKGCSIGREEQGEPERMGGLTRAERGHDMLEHADEDFADDTDEDICPGCGAKPGEGINPDCDDPLGCGYWKAFKADAEGPKGPSLRHMLKNPPSGEETDDVEGFDLPTGEFIENPFWDVSGRHEVDPEEEYGDAFRKSSLAKRLRWGEGSDYDGLPITEAAMFDRFDTLVGSRCDGTFDARPGETERLRGLVKAVVREAWITRDEKTGDEEEHSYDDAEISDMYLSTKADTVKLPRSAHRRHGEVDEMKLGVAGRFGSAIGGYDPGEMDGDEDYKVLEPKAKAPEPAKSGVRAKAKAKPKGKKKS